VVSKDILTPVTSMACWIFDLVFLLISSKYDSNACTLLPNGYTDLDEKTEHVQVTLSKQKYQNSEYDDNTVECLMKYLELESYEQLEEFLEHSHIAKFD
jgi:hypothetical protein